MSATVRRRVVRHTGSYPLGVKITDSELAGVPITAHDFHGTWNYTVHPHQADEQTATK